MRRFKLYITISSTLFIVEAYSQNTATLTVNISNVLSLIVTPVTIYSKLEAKNQTQQPPTSITAQGYGAIQVNSNFPYNIEMMANGKHLVNPNNGEEIPINLFQVDVSGDGGEALSSQKISTHSTQIVNEGAPGMGIQLMLNYSSTDPKIQNSYLPGIYYQTLTFSISVE